jgi:hypothetical protein
MIDIFMTTFHREDFTRKSLELIHERTEPGTFQIHIFDNNSGPNMRKFLIDLLGQGLIVSLHLDSRNTGCLYNKGIFHMTADGSQKYYVVTDNDVFPPKLSPDWLSQMIVIMDAHPDLAFLAPQVPPQWLQTPDMKKVKDDIVYCKAVGNTLKLVRRQAFPIADGYLNMLGAFGDDGLVCNLVTFKRYKTAFCRNIFCYHAGQCDNWGYTDEEISLDPRKEGYGPPFKYELANEETYEPTSENRM